MTHQKTKAGNKICPICSCLETRMYMRGIFDCDQSEVWECSHCGVQFLHPMMEEEEEKQYYKDYYRSQKKRFIRMPNLENIQKERYQYFTEYKKNYIHYVKNAKTILEVGSGAGSFLQLLKDDFKKKDVSFTEKSETNLEYLKKTFKAFSGFSDTEAINHREYDLIVGIAVFEHQRFPLEFLNKLKGLTKTNGYIILEMPNRLEPLIEIYGLEEFKRFNYQKSHYFTYSKETLKILAKQAGFMIEKLYYNQQYGLDNHISWLMHRRAMECKNYLKIFSKTTLQNYKNDLIENQTSDVIGVILKNV